MSKQIPASTTEISHVAEAAGQLGIKTKDVLNFTRVMIDMGKSTNLSSEEAATALARFANITQLDPSKYSNLGSSIVELGNNFATTEKEIVEMGLRLAGTGKVVGLTDPQILGLATAMSSVGIEAEAGGSAFSRVMQKLIHKCCLVAKICGSLQKSLVNLLMNLLHLGRKIHKKPLLILLKG